MKFISIVNNFVSTKKGKIIIAASVIVVASTIVFVLMARVSDRSIATSVSESTSSSVTSSDDGTFAASPAINVTSSKSTSSSSNPISVNVGASSSSKASSTVSKASTASKKTTVSTPIKTKASLKSTSVPTATPPSSTTAASKTSTSYAGYTFLDMTDFNKGSAVYYRDDQDSVALTFESKVYDGSNLPRNSMGSTIVDLGSPTLLYAEGKVTLDNLRSVLINGKKYIGGGKNKYIVTGVYDNSGIAYNRTNIISNPNGVITQVYSKGFVNNPHSSSISYSDGYLCTKISDGGSDAKTGYVRALVFTLKKIS